MFLIKMSISLKSTLFKIFKQLILQMKLLKKDLVSIIIHAFNRLTTIIRIIRIIIRRVVGNPH